MKLSTLTAGAAPLLFLPTLFGSPQPQDVSARAAALPQDDSGCASACQEQVAKACASQEVASCEDEEGLTTVAHLESDGTIVRVAQQGGTSVPMTAPRQEYVASLRSLLQGQNDEAPSEPVTGAYGINIKASDDSGAQWVQVGGDNSHVIVFEDLSEGLEGVAASLQTVQRSLPEVHDSLHSALQTITDSLHSGELKALAHELHGELLHEGSELHSHLEGALETLKGLVKRDPVQLQERTILNVPSALKTPTGSNPLRSAQGFFADPNYRVILRSGSGEPIELDLPEGDAEEIEV
ncbi:MAG: hypothetical protein AAF368_09845, partial [Planctomycetota bacterium]